jgi:hypothetical protein
MYGAKWCGDCQFNFFPWKEEHVCDPEDIIKALNEKKVPLVQEKARLEEAIREIDQRIAEVHGEPQA